MNLQATGILLRGFPEGVAVGSGGGGESYESSFVQDILDPALLNVQ